MTIRAEDIPRSITLTYSTHGMKFKIVGTYIPKAKQWQIRLTDHVGNEYAELSEFPWVQIDAMLAGAFAECQQWVKEMEGVAS